MKKLPITLLLIIALASCQNYSIRNQATPTNKESAQQDSSKEIVAHYNGGKVMIKDVDNEVIKLAVQNTNQNVDQRANQGAKLKDLKFNQLNLEQKEAIIKEVVLKDISYREAKKRNLNKDKDYLEALKIFESELLKQKLFIALAQDASNEKNVRKNYDELVASLKGKKDIRISYIALKTQSEANSLYQILVKSPDSFMAIAKKKSLDKETGKRGGDLGFVMEDALPSDIIKQIKNFKKGDFSKPIKSSDKWLIVKFIDDRPVEINSFDKSKEALAQNLAKKAIEDFIFNSLKQAEINIIAQ